MIRKLHYVWFGGKELPKPVLSCIKSWKKFLPGWQIIEWNEKNFPIDKYRWVKEAIQSKQYAFAADFVRLWALESYGGGYIDTDVELLRNPEKVINHNFVCGWLNHRVNDPSLKDIPKDGIDPETGKPIIYLGIQAGFLYSEPHHPYVVQCMKDFYDNGQRAFVNADGTTNGFVIDGGLIDVITHKFNAVYADRDQYLKDTDIMIYNSSVFATRKSRTPESYLIHWFDQSWTVDHGIISKIKKLIKRHFYFLYRKIF